jgi:hypothetical protein
LLCLLTEPPNNSEIAISRKNIKSDNSGSTCICRHTVIERSAVLCYIVVRNCLLATKRLMVAVFIF